LPTFYDMVFRGGLRVYYAIRGKGVSDFTQLTTLRLEEYKNTKKATTLMNSPILIDSLCTYCTRWLLKIGRVAGFLVPDLLRSCSTYLSSLELPVFFMNILSIQQRCVTFYIFQHLTKSMDVGK
jgi:hypothetical protein